MGIAGSCADDYHPQLDQLDKVRRARLGRYKSKEKHITAPTVVAFKNCFSQRTIFVKTDFLMFCSNLQEKINKRAMCHLHPREKNINS